MKNRRALFTKIAHERGFDPLYASNWYPISIASLLNVKVSLPPFSSFALILFSSSFLEIGSSFNTARILQRKHGERDCGHVPRNRSRGE